MWSDEVEELIHIDLAHTPPRSASPELHVPGASVRFAGARASSSAPHAQPEAGALQLGAQQVDLDSALKLT